MTKSLDFQITLYPSPVLRTVAEPVQDFDQELQDLVEAMYERMFESRGVGLAAPQVGLKKRIMVLNSEGDPSQPDLNLTLINPRIVERTGEKTLMDEGCLSFPEVYAEVQRPALCTVEAQDVEGNPFQEQYSGFVSRIIQHEYDHLEGVLLVDRMSPADKLRNKVTLEDLVERYRRDQAQR